MRHNKLELYVHYVWATWDRLPLIAPDFERSLHRQLEHEALRLEQKPLAVGGVEDHVHVLVEITATITIAEVVKNLKGSSSFFVNQHLGRIDQFKWQGYYAAYTVSRWDVPKIRNYIWNQRQHHSSGSAKDSLELSSDLNDLYIG